METRARWTRTSRTSDCCSYIIQASLWSAASKGEDLRLLCKEIDGRLRSLLLGPLEDDWPYLWLNAAT